MSTSLATLQTYRDEAVAARHALATGSNVAEFWRDGRRVAYSKSDLKALNEYIAQLDREIAEAGVVESGRARRRPITTSYI